MVRVASPRMVLLIAAVALAVAAAVVEAHPKAQLLSRVQRGILDFSDSGNIVATITGLLFKALRFAMYYMMPQDMYFALFGDDTVNAQESLFS
ncbi:hypothetical protein R5R35_007781 [Gryllus longicercus]|uniref:CASP-like protein n=1 Tax=Gryllus longicercus TaxID=2509291 RepID=A0AAN9W532_9ORTH